MAPVGTYRQAPPEMTKIWGPIGGELGGKDLAHPDLGPPACPPLPWGRRCHHLRCGRAGSLRDYREGQPSLEVQSDAVRQRLRGGSEMSW